jgi:hypothetical protein
VITIIKQSSGIISNSFRKYKRNITGKHDFKELEKTAILETVVAVESTNIRVQCILHEK